MGVGFNCVCGGEVLGVFVGRKSPNLFELLLRSCMSMSCMARRTKPACRAAM